MQPTTGITSATPPIGGVPASYPPTYHDDPDVSNLVPKSAVERLIDHGLLVALGAELVEVLYPVVKVTMPFGGPAWLLVAIDADDRNVIHGIRDDVTGDPVRATFTLAEMLAARGDAGLPAERDLHFRAEGDLAWYEDRARVHGTLAF